MSKKTVMVTKPLHLDALRQLEQEVEVLTPFEASPTRSWPCCLGCTAWCWVARSRWDPGR